MPNNTAALADSGAGGYSDAPVQAAGVDNARSVYGAAAYGSDGENYYASTSGSDDTGDDTSAPREVASAPQLTDITVSSSSGTVSRNSTLQMTAGALPDGAALPAVTWTVNNRSGSATIDSSGLLTARAVGTVIVRVATSDGAIYGEKTITITQDPSISPTLEMANLVVFVRFAPEDGEVLADDFNAPAFKSKRTVWTDLKERYNCAITSISDATYPSAVDDSFSQYLREISGGKVEVYNYFPQDYDDNGTAKIAYLDLSETQAQIGDSDETVIAAIIDAFNDPDNNSMKLPADAVLDRRENGVIDNLTIILQGEFSESGIMRSHKSVSSATGTIGGNLVRTYNVLCGDRLLIDKTGLITHEFLHSIGLPDLYRYSGEGMPVGIWDIMASEGGFLQYPLSYQRQAHGWLTLPEITASGEYYLTSPLDGGGNQGFVIRSPMNETEFFVVEYRETNTASGLRGFEQKLPGNGVVVYRVDPSVENQTNANGDDYIYVFRDDETGLGDAYSADRVSSGVLLTEGFSRGTTDFADTFAQRTIFYSDGSNSGVVITANGEQSDGTMKITVSYPDYEALGLWDKLGAAAQSAGAHDGNAIARDAAGNIYVAYIATTGSSSSVYVKKYDGSAWIAYPAAGATAGLDVSLACLGGDVYVSFVDSSGGAAISRLRGGAWSRLYTATCNYSPPQLAADASSLYAASLTSSTNITLLKLNGSASGFNTLGSLTAGYFTPPALEVYNSQPVIASVDFFASGAQTLVHAYDEQAGGWDFLGGFAKAQGYRMALGGGKLWLMRKPQEGAIAYISSFDGNQWSQDITSTSPSIYSEFALAAADDTPVVLTASGNVCRVYRYDGGAFVQRGFDVRSGAQGCDMLLTNETIYAAVTSVDGAVNIYQKPLYDLSRNARLESLSVGAAAFSPAFSANTTEYTASVEASVASVTVSAVAEHSGASVVGAGSRALNYGENTLAVTVTAEDGVTEITYTVVVTRRNITGDVNTDEACNIKDAVLLKQYLDRAATLAPQQLAAADYNADGSVNSADLKNLLTALARS